MRIATNNIIESVPVAELAKSPPLMKETMGSNPVGRQARLGLMHGHHVSHIY